MNADAAACAALQFAMIMQAVNGERGKGHFKPDHWGPHVLRVGERDLDRLYPA